MIKCFKASEFRSLKDINLNYGKINIFIGSNNSGKTNMIRAISWLRDMLTFNQIDRSAFHYVCEQNGRSEMLNRYSDFPGHINLEWITELEGGQIPLSYELDFTVAENQYWPSAFVIQKEKVSYHKPKLGKDKPYLFVECHNNFPGTGYFSVREYDGRPGNRQFPIKQIETVFRQIEELLENKIFREELYPNFAKVLKEIKNHFNGYFSFSSTDFALSTIRKSVIAEYTELYLNNRGTNFINVLANLDEKYRFIRDYTSILQGIFPDIEELKVSTTSNNERALKLFINDKPFGLHEMSDGTVKIFILAMLLFSPEKLTMLAIDEPELNLHPAWLRVLSEWTLNSTSEQIFISTHSPDLLNGFTESYIKGETKVFAFNQNKYYTNVEEVNPNKFKDFFQTGWQLGNLYSVGESALGGWPW